MTSEIIPQRQCIVANCPQPFNRVRVNPQYCLNHFRHWKRYGDPLQFYNSIGDTPAERFWSQVDVTADPERCWLWLGKTMGKGYPRRKYEGAMRIGSHIAWHLTYGRFPQGDVLRHICDTPQCVNPRHLIEGTVMDNIRDRQERQRQARGEKAATSRLRAIDIPVIRKALANQEEAKSIGLRFGVGLSTIVAIKTGKTWGHIPDSDNYRSQYIFRSHAFQPAKKSRSEL